MQRGTACWPSLQEQLRPVPPGPLDTQAGTLQPPLGEVWGSHKTRGAPGDHGDTPCRAAALPHLGCKEGKVYTYSMQVQFYKSALGLWLVWLQTKLAGLHRGPSPHSGAQNHSVHLGKNVTGKGSAVSPPQRSSHSKHARRACHLPQQPRGLSHKRPYKV